MRAALETKFVESVMSTASKVQSGESSTDSIETFEREVLSASGNGSHGSTESVPSSRLQSPMALMRLSSFHSQSHNVLPHQHSTLFYLSLIEGRCRTQAASVLNAGRDLTEHLPEHHPEVESLAQHLFKEMTDTLHKAGVLPDEFAGQELGELRRNYLSSFDAIIHNIAAKKANAFEHNDTYSSALENSTFITTDKDLVSLSIADANAFALRKHTSTPIMLSRLRSLSIQDTPYRKQYKEQCLLGKGGFGKVYKVFHALDGRAYAIKKVVMRVDGDLNPEEKAEQMIAEIRALSRLDHRNIVRYHHCWTENLPAELPGDSSSDGSMSDEDADASVSDFRNVKHLIAGPSSAEKNIKKRLARDLRHQRQVSRMQGEAEDIVFGYSASASEAPAGKGKALVKKSFFRSPSSLGDGDNDSSDSSESVDSQWIVDTKENVDRDGEIGADKLVDKDQNHENEQRFDTDLDLDNVSSTKEITHPSKIVKNSAVFDVVLFIQMSLHPMNLEDYLWPEQQKPGETKIEHCYHCLPTSRILLAILDGVEYIHRNKIVHRDLKPSNIMLSITKDANSVLDGSIKVNDCTECSTDKGSELYITPHIGDFGLVAEIQDPEVSDASLPIGSKAIITKRITLVTPPLPSTSEFRTPKILTTLSSKNRLSTLSVDPVHTSGPGLSTRQPGTRFYVAPRSLTKGKTIICPKVDVYSLGVIALEMIYKFNTRSERAFELDKLKDGRFPHGFENHKMASGIQSMLCREREQRWGCAEVRNWLKNIIEAEVAASGAIRE